MNIISWNLKKIGLNHGRDVNALAREFIQLRASPFVAFILESTGSVDDARQVGANLAGAMGAGTTLPDVQVVSLGGSAYRIENVIAISRGVENPALALLGAWKPDWNQASAQTQQGRLAAEQSRSASVRSRYGFRDTVQDRAATIQADPYPGADDIRDAAIFRGRCDGRDWVIGAVHAPGPSDGSHRGEANAAIYLKSVLPAMAKASVDVVIGDFNIYGDIEPPDGLREVPGLGNTTHGETRVSRLDRIFVRPGIYGAAEKFNEVNNNLSDHMGIALAGAGAHPSTAMNVRRDHRVPGESDACSNCSRVHSWMPALFRYWHVCDRCRAIYCPSCGYHLPPGTVGNRTCKCGGHTQLVS